MGRESRIHDPGRAAVVRAGQSSFRASKNSAAVGARERSVRSGIRISRIKMGNALAPHTDKRARGDVIDRFPDAFDCWKCIAPDGAFAPLFALFLAFVCSAH